MLGPRPGRRGRRRAPRCSSARPRRGGLRGRGVGSARELLDRLRGVAPDALVVDIGLPDADGRDVCQALRARGVRTPVLFLTARDALPDRLAGFAPAATTTSRSRSRSPSSSPGCTRCCDARRRPICRSRRALRLDPVAHAVVHERRRADADRVPPARALLAAAGRGGAAARAGPGGVAARRDRPRQHARRLHRPTPAQAPRAARRAGDRDRARRRLPHQMSRLRAWADVRSRLLPTCCVALAAALVVARTGSTILVRTPPRAEPTPSLRAHARPKLALPRARPAVTCRAPETCGRQPRWVFDRGRGRAPRRAAAGSTTLPRCARRRSARPATSRRRPALRPADRRATARRRGRSSPAISLEPYEQSQSTGAGRVARSRRRSSCSTGARLGSSSGAAPGRRDDRARRAWSEHDLDRRFELGEPHDELTASRRDARRAPRPDRRQPAPRAAVHRRALARAAHAARAGDRRGGAGAPARPDERGVPQHARPRPRQRAAARRESSRPWFAAARHEVAGRAGPPTRTRSCRTRSTP